VYFSFSHNAKLLLLTEHITLHNPNSVIMLLIIHLNIVTIISSLTRLVLVGVKIKVKIIKNTYFQISQKYSRMACKRDTSRTISRRKFHAVLVHSRNFTIEIIKKKTFYCITIKKSKL
jgi:hypothetical protein